MKLVIRTLVFHVACIVIFAFLYSKFSEDFLVTDKNKKSFIDFLLLSTTIQCGIGISDLYPFSFIGKIILIFQQMILLCTHVITIYIFTL